MIAAVALEPDYTAYKSPLVQQQSQDVWDAPVSKLPSRTLEQRSLEGAYIDSGVVDVYSTPAGNKNAAKEKIQQKVDHIKSDLSSELILSAYISKVQDLIDEWSTDVGGTEKAGDVIRLSEKYLQSLNSYSSYRLFISTVAMTIKSNLDLLDAKKLKLFQGAIQAYDNSPKVRGDTQRFVKKLDGFGLQPLRLGV